MVFAGTPLRVESPNLLVHAAFGVTGHIDDMTMGMKVPDLVGKLRAAQFGHDHVGEENVDGAGMMAREFEGFQGDGQAQGDLVVDEKNCEGARFVRRGRDVPLFRLFVRRRCGASLTELGCATGKKIRKRVPAPSCESN
jgi:hypothetical protein